VSPTDMTAENVRYPAAGVPDTTKAPVPVDVELSRTRSAVMKAIKHLQ